MLGLTSAGFAAAGLLALLVSAALTPLVGRAARARRPLPVAGPAEREPPPRAGLAVGVAFIVPSLLFPLGPTSRGILLAVGLTCLWGALEDSRGINSLTRLMVLTAAGAVLIRSGVALSFLPATAWGVGGEWALTVLWVVGISIGFAALDRLDGLASGTAAANLLFVGFHALTTRQGELAVLAAALLGGTVGLLPYNFRARPREARARYSLGASGALPLGVALAGLTVTARWAESVSKDLLVPVLILAVPWLAALTLLQDVVRAPQGRARLAAWWGGAPVAPRPMGLRVRRKEAVAVLWLASLCFGSSALLFRGSNPYDAVLVLGQVVVVFGIIGYAYLVVKKRRAGDRPGT
jgi:UDP-N-acetylmuramyl pentapeptide phosphotransferase/UDP-N-acetylglucosamine-1-phosphate transferase